MSNSLNVVSIEKAVEGVKSGDRVFIQGAAMTPIQLIEALCQRYEEFEKVEVVHIHTEGKALYAEKPYSDSFMINSFFVGGNVRKAINTRQGDYIPIFLSEIHLLFKRNILPLDFAFIQVSPPDKHGFCSLGTSLDVTLQAIKSAKKVVAQVNPKVPRTHGDGMIHQSMIDYAVEVDVPIYIQAFKEPSEIEKQIGKHVAGLIENGATLQMGIGGIPNAVLYELHDHKELGIHTEMFSNGLLPLVEKGVISGQKKTVDRGKIVSCFVLGDQELYDFVDDNPILNMREAAYTNDTAIIRKNPKVTAINSAIEIDLTGQVCADTIGSYQYSGVGGQMDFIRGASLSPEGKPIIAMPSVTSKGISKIVGSLKPGAGVTTTRAHVQYVATEYGIVDLYGKNLRQRTQALISIAHPDFREELEKEAFEVLNY
jgi:acyl-CoA hydrolase